MAGSEATGRRAPRTDRELHRDASGAARRRCTRPRTWRRWYARTPSNRKTCSTPPPGLKRRLRRLDTLHRPGRRPGQGAGGWRAGGRPARRSRAASPTHRVAAEHRLVRNESRHSRWRAVRAGDGATGVGTPSRPPSAPSPSRLLYMYSTTSRRSSRRTRSTLEVFGGRDTAGGDGLNLNLPDDAPEYDASIRRSSPTPESRRTSSRSGRRREPPATSRISRAACRSRRWRGAAANAAVRADESRSAGRPAHRTQPFGVVQGGRTTLAADCYSMVGFSTT